MELTAGRHPFPAAMACFVGMRQTGPWEEQVWTLYGNLAARSGKQGRSPKKQFLISLISWHPNIWCRRETAETGTGALPGACHSSAFLSLPAKELVGTNVCLDLSVLVVFGCFFCLFFGWFSRTVVSKVECMQDNSLGCRRNFSSTCIYLINNKHTYIGSTCSKFFSDGMNPENSLETTALEGSCSV